MNTQQPTAQVSLRVWGDYACFTRPEMKTERVSYDVMTPSAARAVFEAILWKPSIEWRITQIDVLKPIRWFTIRRNEVEDVISEATVRRAMNSGAGNLGLYIEEKRQQRAALVLRNVEYVLHGELRLTPKAGRDENLKKFEEMFLRRAEKGQCFHHPYLGTREFVAHFEPFASAETAKPIAENRDLGWMFYDFDYSDRKAPKPRFFKAEMNNGTVAIPEPESEWVRA